MTPQDELLLRLQAHMGKYSRGQMDIAVKYRGFIEAARQQQASWKAIAAVLSEDAGRQISPNALKTWWWRVNKEAV